MFKHELTQLISVAKFYLAIADEIELSRSEQDMTIEQHSVSASASLTAESLTALDRYFAHLGSAAIRLATIHEIIAGNARVAWRHAYPKPCEPTPTEIQRGIDNGFEILFRDNIAHSQHPPVTIEKASAFREAVLGNMTAREVSSTLKTRCQKLEEEVRGYSETGSGFHFTL